MELPNGTFITDEELDPRRMLMTLATYHGIGPEVEILLDTKGTPSPPMHKGGLAGLLVRARTLRKMTVVDIHKRSGIAKSQIGFYESGGQKNPGLRTLRSLSYGYRIPFMLVIMAAIQDITPRAQPKRRRDNT